MLPGLARANREVQGALGAEEGSRFKCMFDHHRAGGTESRLKEEREIDLRAGMKRGEEVGVWAPGARGGGEGERHARDEHGADA
jgi:hypothetical protein